MALHDLRDATRDVDTVTRLTDNLRDAVTRVATQRGYVADWLNDHSAAFLPRGLNEQDCELLFEHPSLHVLIPPPSAVFLMKLYAARGDVDHQDMVRLWPLCDFTSAQDAIARYWDAYPHAITDDYLTVYVEQIASEADHHH